MNRKDVPADDWRRETGSADEHQPLSEIEQRLRAARPHPVQLDAAAWERIVSASQISVAAEEGAASLPVPVSPFHRRWHRRTVSAIAAAWLSGVVVGSGVMFLMMDRGGEITQGDDRETPVAVAQRNRESTSVSPDIQPPPKPDSRSLTDDGATTNPASSDRPVLSPSTDDGLQTPPGMEGDSAREIRSASWLDASTFQRDEPLRALDRERFEIWTPAVLSSRPPYPKTLSPEERPQQSDSQRELVRSFVPSPGATPRRILEELRMDGEIL